MNHDKKLKATSAAIKSARNHVWHHMTQHKPFEQHDPMLIVKGKGMRVTDAKGKEYLDATSGGVWTTNVGYGRESIAKAVYEQLVTMHYFAQSVSNIPASEFAEKLIHKMPGMSRVYYSSSGSEANEKGYKMVRQIAHKKYDGKKYKILYRNRDYHGTTITALSSSAHFERKNQYGPFTPGFIEFPDCCAYRSSIGSDPDYGVKAALEMEKVILAEGPDTVGAVVLEPITSGGGVIVPPEGYWETIQEICSKYDILLHIDEVVCGLGRTGKWFGYQHYGVKPDIVTLGKGLTSGYAAISCTVTTEAVFDLFKGESTDRMGYFRDISTFAGCMSGPVAALENMRILEQENLVQNSAKMGEYLLDQLNVLKDKYSVIGDVTGKGLIAGLKLVKDRASKEPVDESLPMAIVKDCMGQGVLIGRTTRSFREYNNTIILSPALIATRGDIDEIVKALDVSLNNQTT